MYNARFALDKFSEDEVKQTTRGGIQRISHNVKCALAIKLIDAPAVQIFVEELKNTMGTFIIKSLRLAVKAGVTSHAKTEEMYRNISGLDVIEVHDMCRLFKGSGDFDEDLTA